MNKKIRLAMFFIITIVLFVVSIISFGKIRIVSSDHRIYIDYIFTGDLRVNGKLAYRGGGIVIGFIEDISINPDGTIRVTVVITNDKVILPEGTRFTIQAVGFGLGEKYIMATPPVVDTRGYASIPKNSVVRGIDPVSIEATLNEIGTDINFSDFNYIIENVNSSIENLNRILEGEAGNLGISLVNIRDITSKINLIMSDIENGQGALGAIIQDEGVYSDVKSIVSNFELFSRKISENPSVLIFGENKTNK